jgi:hypothetical protein
VFYTYNERKLILITMRSKLDLFSTNERTSLFVHIVYSYDYDGNRTKRYDPVHATNSELYTYDNLGQIKTLNRRVLNNDVGEVNTICGQLLISLEANGGAQVTVHLDGVPFSLGASVFVRGSLTYGVCLTCPPSSCSMSGFTLQNESIVAGVHFCYGRCWEYTWGVSAP